MRPGTASPARPRAGLSRWLAHGWPWAVLLLAMGVGAWHLVDFPNDVDQEFPEVVRPTFSAFPPATYRLAEPGDTLDRVAMYLASACVAVAGVGAIRRGPAGSLWISGLGLALAAFWFTANPWPTFDGWHGLGWRVIGDAEAPAALRAAVGLAAVIVGAMIAVPIATGRRALPLVIARVRRDGRGTLLGTAAVLIAVRLAGWPEVGPPGYGTRWALIGGLWLFLSAMLRALPPWPPRRLARLAIGAAAAGLLVGLVQVGLGVIWYHRPLERLREIEPGRIYISAMPHGRGLELAHRRHGFKTIINLFQEDLPGLRSPHLDAEIAFAKRHGIHYIRSPDSAEQADDFLDETLRLATDPDAWPVLVHCHGCMDRTPAWWGIYQFVVQGKPLAEAIRSIEQHRGSRPKGSVTLLYNRVLPELAPERYRDDPTAAALRANAQGTVDPFLIRLAEERRLARESSGTDDRNRE
ncbi:protein tyrosine phosphatase [Tautonia sociabilis]|nr:protein tyrosine phosphatase [Tautonia sociabilis]